MTAATLFTSIAACSAITPLLLYGTSSCPYLCSFILTGATALLLLENIFLHKEIRQKDEVGSTRYARFAVYARFAASDSTCARR